MKNSILQLAIQGKLVEQRPEEGTGEELYRQIQKKKQELIKAGTIKKEKPLPEISEDDIPFDIPTNWKWIRLGNVASVFGGKRIPAGRTLSTENTGYKYIRVSDMKNGSVLTDHLLYVPVDIYPSISRYVINKEDVYITVAGTIGRVGKIPSEIDGANLTENADRLVFQVIDQDWLIKCLESLLIQKQIADATTKVGQPKLAIKRIQEFFLPLPPLAEQKRIVAKIEELLPYIDRYEKAWSRLEDFKKRFPVDMQKSILQMAIQGKLVEQCPEEGTGEELFQQIQAEKQKLFKEGKIKKEKPLPEISEDEILFEIPENWKWCRFGTAISLLSGTDFKPEEYNDKGKGTVYITGASCLSETGVIQCRWTVSPRVIAERGDVLLVCKGSGYGKTAICDIEKAHIARQIMAIKKLQHLDMNYIMFYLQANLNEIKGNGQGVIPGIDRGSIRNMLFPLPPLAEQKRIVAKLEEILPLCERIQVTKMV